MATLSDIPKGYEDVIPKLAPGQLEHLQAGTDAFIDYLEWVRKGSPMGPGNKADVKPLPWAESKALRELLEPLIRMAEVTDTSDTIVGILERIARGNTMEEISGNQTLPSAEDYMGEWMECRGFRVAKSTEPGGLPVYLILDLLRRETGELITLSIGASNVTIQLARWWQVGSFPVMLKFVQPSKASSSGRLPISVELRPVPVPPKQAVKA